MLSCILLVSEIPLKEAHTKILLPKIASVIELADNSSKASFYARCKNREEIDEFILECSNEKEVCFSLISLMLAITEPYQ